MYKTKLQELCQQNLWVLPEYQTVKDGPDHKPRFTATVVVNGVSFENTELSRSSKEAQNQAAKLAFDHFTAPKPILQHSPISPVSSSSIPQSSGFSTSNACVVDVGPSGVGILQPTQQGSVQIFPVNETSLGFKDDKSSTGFSTSNACVVDIRPSGVGILQPTQQESVQISPVNETSLGFKDDKRSTGFSASNACVVDIRPPGVGILQPTQQGSVKTSPVNGTSLGFKDDKRSKGFSTSNTCVMDIGPSGVGILQPTQQRSVQISPVNETSLGFKDDKRSTGFSTSNACVVDIRPPGVGLLQPTQQGSVQMSPVIETSLSSKDDKRSKDMLLHAYKNRLQIYAQKRNVTLPVYCCDTDGPPHARRFKSRVTVDGKTYETTEFFPTLKEAQNAAAKVAFESLSCSEVQEDEGLYKGLLQELAQKEGFCFPTYETTHYGLSHMPTFVSTVEVAGKKFKGQESKAKKQAEMNAAKVAYLGLTESRASVNPTVLFPACPIMGSSGIESLSLQSIIAHGPQPEMRPIASSMIHEKKAEEDKGVGSSCLQSTITDGPQPEIRPNANNMIHAKQAEEDLGKANGKKEALNVSSSGVQLAETDDSRQSTKLKAKLVMHEEQDSEDEVKSDMTAHSFKQLSPETSTKRHRSSSLSDNVYARLRDPFPSSSPENGASAGSTHSRYTADSDMEADIVPSAGADTLGRNKVLVYPRGQNMTFTDGATVLPISDDKWVAVGVKAKQNQQMNM